MSPAVSSRFRAAWVGKTLLVTGLLVVLGMVIIPSNSCGCISSPRAVHSSNLRQIGQAALIYAAGYEDQLPQTDTVVDFAAALAREAGLNDPNIWIVEGKSARDTRSINGPLLTPDGTAPTPEFLRARLGYTIVTRGLHAKLPETTPIAWTRGLQPDGTWSKDSPYGGEGGHIVFLGGNVTFFRKLADAPLPRFDDPKATTTDIRQALPPEAFIAEPRTP